VQVPARQIVRRVGTLTICQRGEFSIEEKKCNPAVSLSWRAP
jgi:hypothetical protein